jgi:enterochelin esterase-like enzyme
MVPLILLVVAVAVAGETVAVAAVRVALRAVEHVLTYRAVWVKAVLGAVPAPLVLMVHKPTRVAVGAYLPVAVAVVGEYFPEPGVLAEIMHQAVRSVEAAALVVVGALY